MSGVFEGLGWIIPVYVATSNAEPDGGSGEIKGSMKPKRPSASGLNACWLPI